MRIHSDTARRQASGISDSTLIRIRASSPRLVSCVAVVIISVGQDSRRRAFASWNSAGVTPSRPGWPPDVVGRDEHVVPVERRVLDALGLHGRA